jgi:pyruvate dehydrogenase E1 component alpha subunit
MPSVTEDEVAMDPADYAGAEINASLKPKQKIGFLREMIRIRRFEQTSLQYYDEEGVMGGFLHLYIGQEAVAVGTVSLLGKNDHVITALPRPWACSRGGNGNERVHG